MNPTHKYVFFGTADLSLTILEKLIEADFVPNMVICNPDRPVGRKRIVTPPPTKVLAEKHNIPVWQPEKISKDPSSYPKEITGAGFAVIAAYAKILPKEILDAPRLGTIGVHPSLLPKYRGATPIQSAILNGEKETGVTLFMVDEEVDHGAILAAAKLQLTEEDSYTTLQQKLAELGAQLLIDTLPRFLEEKITPEIQNDDEATFTKKFTTADAQVDLKKDDPRDTYRKIKALNPEPGTYTFENEKRIKLLDAELTPEGKLKLKKIQTEGKKPRTNIY